MKKELLLLSLLLLLSCVSKEKDRKTADTIVMKSNEDLSKAFVSLRVGIPLWNSDARFNELLALLDRHKGAVDEIALFSSITHAPIPADVFLERTRIMKLRMEEARKHGYRAGINIIATLGHHNENLENSLKGKYTHMTNIEGDACEGSFCPNDENFKNYVATIYRYSAEAKPDFIWIDDDMRLYHWPVGYGCFCDHCLDIFNKETGYTFTRAELKKSLNQGKMEDKLRLRRLWIDHNRNTFFRLFATIEKAVHETDPHIAIGQMTGERAVEGYDYDKWAEILSGNAHAAVMWRPGAGYYDDNINSNLAGKAHTLGNQVAVLPPQVKSIQAEIENFPYQRLKKSAHIVSLEAASYIAAGCTGAAYNVLTFYDEPLDEYEPLIAKLQSVRPFFDLMVSKLGRIPLSGACKIWNKNTIIADNAESGTWLEGSAATSANEIFGIGIPASYSGDHAKVAILGKDVVPALSDEEIRKVLSTGVYMDCEVLKQLNERGFGKLTGFEISGSENKDRIEKFSSDPLNGRMAGRERDNRQSFWMLPAFTLRPTDKKAASLAGLIDYSGKKVSSCTAGIYENELGGRVCVSGYYPYTFMESLSKSTQMKNIFRWLSHDELPGYVASYHKINLWIREPVNGNCSLAFTNSSFDAAKDVVLMLRTDKTALRMYDMQCNTTLIRSIERDGPYQKFVINNVDPWEARLLTTE
jgi:hypothetical protein